MKAKISSILVLLFFSSVILFSQETGKILYSNGPCLGSNKHNEEGKLIQMETNLSFTLENDSLRIVGVIEANCCGSHLLSYTVSNDSLLIYRTDEGELCDCMCCFNIDVKIGKCTSKEYTVCLAKYAIPSEWEISKKVAYSSVLNKTIKEANIYPNPFNSSTQIEFDAISSEVYKFELYNEFGELVRSINDIGVGRITLNRDNLSSGVYFYRILQADGECKFNGAVTLH